MKKILVIITLGLGINCQAQLTDQEASNALAKYWLYKWRFLNDFIKVGDLNGESIPVSERAAMGQPIFKFGDGTQKLGMYLCLLATEYKLLFDNNRWVDLEKTKTELYYAIEAYRRLDCEAELQQPYYKDPDYDWCNGYFMRDDIRIDFLQQPAKPWIPSNTETNVDHFNQDFTSFCYGFDPDIPSGPVNELRIFPPGHPSGEQNCSDWEVQEHPLASSEELVNEESQDQAFCLIQGLGLIAKLVTPFSQNVTLNDGTVISYNFVVNSKELLEDLIWYIKKKSQVTSTGTFFQQVGNDWIIHNPINEKVFRGPNAYQFSFPMATIANQFFSSNYYDLTTNTFRAFWNVQQINLSGNGNFGDLNTSMQCQLAAMSDAWYTNIGPFGINVTPQSLYAKAEDHDWEAFYLPFWSIWNNKPMPSNIKNQVFYAMYDDIRSAPCQGPYRFLHQGSGTPIITQQWGGVFKYFKSLNVTHNGVGAYIPGYYNGTDYMLLNNLHYLVSTTPLPMFHNLIDRFVDYPIPGIAPGNPLGINVPQPLMINAFHTLTANNTVQEDWQIEFRAGYEITFSPGFHVEAGADFHAYIEPFTCVNGEYRNVEDSSLATAYGFNERFTLKNHGIINDASEDESEDLAALESEMNPAHHIMVFPNPSDGIFSYALTEKLNVNSIHQIEVYNMIGDLIYQDKVSYNGQHQINLGEVTPGMYIVKVISGEIVYSTKLMVE